MNRHERRKARAIGIEEVPADSPRAAEGMARGAVCCWRECEQTFKGLRMPEGWRSLLIFWSAWPVSTIAEIPRKTWDRDGVLCPEHTKALEALLKDLGRGLKESEPAGRA